MNNLACKSKNDLIDNFIVTFLLIVILVFHSLKTIAKVFSYGIFKKEILTTKSNLGFDIKIKIK